MWLVGRNPLVLDSVRVLNMSRSNALANAARSLEPIVSRTALSLTTAAACGLDLLSLRLQLWDVLP